jgi:hypothetical protein
MSKQVTQLGTFACVDCPVWGRHIVRHVKKDRMRIFCDGGYLDDMKCGAGIDDHHNKLQDVDSNKHVVCIVSFEIERKLDDFAREC